MKRKSKRLRRSVYRSALRSDGRPHPTAAAASLRDGAPVVGPLRRTHMAGPSTPAGPPGAQHRYHHHMGPPSMAVTPTPVSPARTLSARPAFTAAAAVPSTMTTMKMGTTVRIQSSGRPLWDDPRRWICRIAFTSVRCNLESSQLHSSCLNRSRQQPVHELTQMPRSRLLQAGGGAAIALYGINFVSVVYGMRRLFKFGLPRPLTPQYYGYQPAH